MHRAAQMQRHAHALPAAALLSTDLMEPRDISTSESCVPLVNMTAALTTTAAAQRRDTEVKQLSHSSHLCCNEGEAAQRQPHEADSRTPQRDATICQSISSPLVNCQLPLGILSLRVRARQRNLQHNLHRKPIRPSEVTANEAAAQANLQFIAAVNKNIELPERQQHAEQRRRLRVVRRLQDPENQFIRAFVALPCILIVLGVIAAMVRFV